MAYLINAEGAALKDIDDEMLDFIFNRAKTSGNKKNIARCGAEKAARGQLSFKEFKEAASTVSDNFKLVY